MQEALIGPAQQSTIFLQINCIMSDIQKKIQDVVLHLFKAFEDPPFDCLVIDDAVAVMEGIDDGSFF